MNDNAQTSAPLDRLGLGVLDPEVCWELMTRAAVGRVAFMDEGGPMVLPVIHAVVGRRIVFRSQPGGKLDAARMGGQVAFEVDGWDVADRTGWSVVARGSAQSAPEDAAELDALRLDTWLEPAGRGTWIEILVEEITGRHLGNVPA